MILKRAIIATASDPNLSMADIGNDLGCTREYVRQVIEKAGLQRQCMVCGAQLPKGYKKLCPKHVRGHEQECVDCGSPVRHPIERCRKCRYIYWHREFIALISKPGGSTIAELAKAWPAMAGSGEASRRYESLRRFFPDRIHRTHRPSERGGSRLTVYSWTE